MVNSYTTNRMYATTVPTPASNAGDLLVISYAPDATSPDNAIGGAEVAFVSIANVLAIPNAYTAGPPIDGRPRGATGTDFGPASVKTIGSTSA